MLLSFEVFLCDLQVLLLNLKASVYCLYPFRPIGCSNSSFSSSRFFSSSFSAAFFSTSSFFLSFGGHLRSNFGCFFKILQETVNLNEGPQSLVTELTSTLMKSARRSFTTSSSVVPLGLQFEIFATQPENLTHSDKIFFSRCRIESTLQAKQNAVLMDT